jgi:hypothetical protein
VTVMTVDGGVYLSGEFFWASEEAWQGWRPFSPTYTLFTVITVIRERERE